MEKNILSDTNTLGYVMISIIGTLFVVGTGSIIMAIITELPPSVPYKRSENKVSLSVINGSILSGIDVQDVPVYWTLPDGRSGGAPRYGAGNFAAWAHPWVVGMSHLAGSFSMAAQRREHVKISSG